MTRAEVTPVQDPEMNNFLMRLRKKNTDGDSHEKTVDQYYSYFTDRDHLDKTEDGVKDRRQGI